MEFAYTIAKAYGIVENKPAGDEKFLTCYKGLFGSCKILKWNIKVSVVQIGPLVNFYVLVKFIICDESLNYTIEFS